MPRRIEIHVKVKPYLIKYVCNHATDRVLNINRASLLGNFILSNLRYPPRGWRPEKIKEEEKLRIAIPSHYIQDCALGTYLNDEVKEQIQDGIEASYWEDMYNYIVSRQLKYGEKELVALRQFRANHFTFEEDYLEESALKRYRRNNKKKKIHAIKGLR